MSESGGRGRVRIARRWWVLGLIAFLLIDIVLVWWAVQGPGAAESSDTEPLPLTAFAPAPTPRPAISEPSPTPTPTLAPIVLETFARDLVAQDAERAWRTWTLACAGPTTIESTGDAGATWTAWSTRDDVWGVRAIVGYTGDESMVGIVASLAGDCRAEYRISFTGGEFWGAYPGEQPELVMIDPADAAVLVAPIGAVGSPCGPVSEVAESESGVGVLCADTQIRIGTSDLGSWTDPLLPGAPVAIAASGDGYLVASRRDPACLDGLALSRVGSDGGVEAGACVPGHPDEAEPVTLATAPDGSIWLWAGDRTGVSVDGGASWTGS